MKSIIYRFIIYTHNKLIYHSIVFGFGWRCLFFSTCFFFASTMAQFDLLLSIGSYIFLLSHALSLCRFSFATLIIITNIDWLIDWSIALFNMDLSLYTYINAYVVCLHRIELSCRFDLTKNKLNGKKSNKDHEKSNWRHSNASCTSHATFIHTHRHEIQIST